MTGGEAVVRMLSAYGVEFAFGMGGFQALPYYDALARQETVRHILIRDERNGAFAADGYARVRNRPAVADATLGPGATNLISGLAESFGASIPMIALTGEVNSAISGRGATQESDQWSMLKPTCKGSISITRSDRIPELMRRAFSIANGGRPGPVNVNIPEDVFHAQVEILESEFHVNPGSEVVCGRRIRPDSSLVDKAVDLLRSAAAPVILAGGGVHLSAAYEELRRLVDVTGIPVATTISGKGSIAEDHDLALGICGRYSRCANSFIEEADALLVVGCKLGEIATSRWSLVSATTRVVHVDIDPGEIGHVYTPAVGIWGDAKLTLSDLADALEGEVRTLGPRKPRLLGKVGAMKSKWLATALPSYRSRETPVHMARLLHDLRAVMPAESILVADGGFAAHWSALFYDVTAPGRTYIANRGHAAIGYGLAGAIGAKLAAPERPVIALCGDNGFAMAVTELETAKRAGAPVICVVVNNLALGYVKALQHGMYGGRFISVDFEDVDYVAIARALGCNGRRVDSPDDLAPVFADALAEQMDAPFVVDVRTTTDPAAMLPGIDTRILRAKVSS